MLFVLAGLIWHVSGSDICVFVQPVRGGLVWNSIGRDAVFAVRSGYIQQRVGPDDVPGLRRRHFWDADGRHIADIVLQVPCRNLQHCHRCELELGLHAVHPWNLQSSSWRERLHRLRSRHFQPARGSE